MNTITTPEGSPLAWQQLGEGTDAVLIHGLATNRAFWYANLAQRLKERQRVTLYDLRGHGYSGRPPSGYSSAHQAGDLLALLDGLKIEQADLIGHSYGGSIALEFAVQQPQRVRSLVLMDSRINILQPQQWLSDSPHLSAFEREVAAADGRDWEFEPQIGFVFLEAIARLHVQGYRASARDAFTPFAEGRGGLRGARQYLELLAQTSAALDFLAAGASAAAIAALKAPLLLLYGEHSRCRPSGDALSQVLPEARYAQAEQGGHFFPATHADWVAQQVLEFLQLHNTTNREAA